MLPFVSFVIMAKLNLAANPVVIKIHIVFTTVMYSSTKWIVP